MLQNSSSLQISLNMFNFNHACAQHLSFLLIYQQSAPYVANQNKHKEQYTYTYVHICICKENII